MKNRIIAIIIIVLLLGFGLIFNELTSKGEIKNNNGIDWEETITTTQEQPTTTQELKAKQYDKKNTKKNTKKKAKKKKKKVYKTYKKVKTASKDTYYNYAKEQGSYNDEQMSCLINLWNRESGWNPNSRNKSSGACGIPQAYPCSKIKKQQGSNDWQAQIRWGINYIGSKYKSPCKAWKHFKKKGWY